MMRLLSLACLASAVAAFVPAGLRTATTSSSLVTTPSYEDAMSYAPCTQLNAMLTQTELPEKLYFPQDKETPKALGGLKIGLRKLVVITGASSGLGLQCAKTLAKTGRYFVVMACRDVEKAKKGKNCSSRSTNNSCKLDRILCFVNPNHS